MLLLIRIHCILYFTFLSYFYYNTSSACIPKMAREFDDARVRARASRARKQARATPRCAPTRTNLRRVPRKNPNSRAHRAHKQ